MKKWTAKEMVPLQMCFTQNRITPLNLIHEAVPTGFDAIPANLLTKVYTETFFNMMPISLQCPVSSKAILYL